jgi:hypothetical protein
VADFAERLKAVPAGRVAQGWESAALALYLASAESDFVSGQNVRIFGWMGRVMGQRLSGKRIVVTDAGISWGPPSRTFSLRKAQR